MKRRGSGLAARFRTAVSNEAERKTDAQRAAEQQLEADREERERLFDDLAALGADLPIDGSHRLDDGVRFDHADHSLTFKAGPEATVTVDFLGRPAGDEQRLFRQHELGGRWVWSRSRRGREDRLPLFDQALEILLVHALGLPEPQSAPPVADEPADPTIEPTGTPAKRL